MYRTGEVLAAGVTDALNNSTFTTFLRGIGRYATNELAVADEEYVLSTLMMYVSRDSHICVYYTDKNIHRFSFRNVSSSDSSGGQCYSAISWFCWSCRLRRVQHRRIRDSARPPCCCIDRHFCQVSTWNVRSDRPPVGVGREALSGAILKAIS